MEDLSTMRAVAAIDTAALIHNYQALRSFASQGAEKPPRMIAVVKANAYGHGLMLAAKAFLRAGCDFFGVATIEEALTLRKITPSADILVLGYTPPHRAGQLAAKHITQTVFSVAYAAMLASAAVQVGVTVPIHIKIDCGMHRLGFSPNKPNDILIAATQKGLQPTGVYTHFAAADTDAVTTQAALNRFLDCRASLSDSGLTLFAHAAASAALLSLPQSVLDGVRPGLALYGISPVPTTLQLRPALTVLTHIVQIHDLPADTPVGYGGSFVTKKPSRIGTAPLGYGDGIPRSFSGQTVCVFHQGNAFFVPVVGRICMDQMMLDLEDTPIEVGDTVQVFTDISRTASALHTIPYEILTALGPRITRRARSG